MIFILITTKTVYLQYQQTSFCESVPAAIQGANTGFILIPATASIGNTRMRVVAVEGSKYRVQLEHILGVKQKIIVSILLRLFHVVVHQTLVLQLFLLTQVV